MTAGQDDADYNNPDITCKRVVSRGKKQLISVFLGTKMVRWFKHPGGGGSRIGSIPLGVTPLV